MNRDRKRARQIETDTQGEVDVQVPSEIKKINYKQMKKLLVGLVTVLVTVQGLQSQIPLPLSLPQRHPRLLATDAQKPQVQRMVEQEAWAGEVLDGIRGRIDSYVLRHTTDPEWMVSRLMMYWKSKATNVYIKGGVYSHADGEAPVPTVRFGSSRGLASTYARPKLEDIIPYMDDTKGVFFHNTAKPGRPLEWGEQANASGIESINEQIMSLAKDAAFVYWLTGDERYARFAADLFDTYMLGMYYRKEPVDLNNSHAQTLVGLSTFEVIQERILNELAYLYDFAYPFLQKRFPEKMEIYAATFKKWIDISIKNGVPQNNWNLHQAKFILKVAMVLEDNACYADGKGREFYINHILNVSTPRQWSLTRFLDYGYDPATGIWNESPGYAQNVTRDLTNFIRDFDATFAHNILPYTPVMHKAVGVLPQYLFPNNQITAFGDSYYGTINTDAIHDMILMAQKYGNKADEERYTAMYKLFVPDAGTASTQRPAASIFSFFTTRPLQLKPEVKAAEADDYITQTFYAPNVSWLVQRNERDRENGLMISQVGSYGNHAHANGISIELYGKGYVLGAESGIGSSYFQAPFLEYYSQFPAHNTVMVDGISKYPEMLSNHPFDLLSMYPESGQKTGYYPGITFSDVYFLEPESRSDQRRFLSIVRTSDSTGYYVDIFRSKKQRAGDKFHDYFYHNLGQELTLTDASDSPLQLMPSEEMAFAGGHLFALDYLWDKRSVCIETDYKAVWKMERPNGNHVYMNLWMKGYPGRELFAMKAPPCKAFRANHGLPYDVTNEPFLTIAARQHGEAWNRPFVSVFEPSTTVSGRSVESIESFDAQGVASDFVGLKVTSANGRTDYIFSSSCDEQARYSAMQVQATYAVISEQGKDFTLMMGNGKWLSAKGFTIEAKEAATVVLEFKKGKYYVTADGPCTVKPAGGRKKVLDTRSLSEIKF